jgi:ribosomal protein L12E/L44/L45/RPP1/RPP2
MNSNVPQWAQAHFKPSSVEENVMIWPNQSHARRVCAALSDEIAPMTNVQALVVLEEVMGYADEVYAAVWAETMGPTPLPPLPDPADDEDEDDAEEEEEEEEEEEDSKRP